MVDATTVTAPQAMVNPMMRAKADVRGLSFFYGNFQGLKNINLTIHDKQVTAMIGPSPN